MNKIIK